MTCVLAFFSVCGTAQAAAPLSHWWPWHYDGVDDRRLYTNDGKIPLTSQWEFDTWTPDVWTKDRGSEKAVMEGLYAADIIRDQEHDGGIWFIHMGMGAPVLVVGPGFLKLSDRDKRRVIIYAAKAWGVSDDGMMYVNYKDGDPLFSHDEVGVYAKGAVQLQ